MPHCRSSRALVALTASFCAIPAGAQAPEKFIVTSSRLAQPIADALADVTVIGEEEILRSTAQSLPQLLQRQPGVEVTLNGGPGSNSGVFLRGANASQTLVLVDGLRVSSSSAGATTIEAIPLDQIERIEILRGPASSLYGADAIGGVIQVFTKRGAPGLRGHASASYGTHNTGNASAGLRGGTGAVRYSLQAGITESDGFNAIVNPANFGYNPDRDGYSTRNLGGSVAFDWAPGHSLEVRGMRNKLDAQTDGGPDFDDRTLTTVEAYSLVSRNRFAKSWSSVLTLGQGRDDSVSKSAFGDFPFETEQRQLMWQNDVGLPVGTLSVVLERREEKLATTNDFAVTSRDTDSIGAVYQLREGAWALQGNVRLDDSNQYGEQTTGGISAGYHVTPAWRLTAGYSTAFKAPSFNDLYFPFFSNPLLVPEEAKNAEIGSYWNWRMGASRFDAKAVAYRNRVTNLIVFGCDESFNCRPDNVEKANLEGVTLGLDWSHGGTRVAGSLDLQRPENANTGNLLPRRARKHGTLLVTHDTGPITVGAEWIASSERYDNAANTVRLAGYGIVNLTAEWRFARGWTAFLRGNNVFDRDYVLAADYSTGGATVMAGVRFSP
jgi:vitamin B12 transporter